LFIVEIYRFYWEVVFLLGFCVFTQKNVFVLERVFVGNLGEWKAYYTDSSQLSWLPVAVSNTVSRVVVLRWQVTTSIWYTVQLCSEQSLRLNAEPEYISDRNKNGGWINKQKIVAIINTATRFLLLQEVVESITFYLQKNDLGHRGTRPTFENSCPWSLDKKPEWMAPQIPVDTSPVDHRGTAAQSWFV